MENLTTIFDPLFEKAEAYGKTSLEIAKLKALDKTSEVASNIASRGIVFLVLSLFVVTLSIGVALWLGSILGEVYYGFFCVAGFYALLGIVLYFFLHDKISRAIGNSIISNVLN
ncbi:MAG: hypothetical protein Q8T03_09640 [Bacteroidota bacterium]|nr:hypothetical protein [Bacteroidota bacterium]